MDQPDASWTGYRAAGVVFFTREAEQVSQVLLSLEERRLSGRQVGLATSEANDGDPDQGKVPREVLVFPQGRRERKDEGDPVETAMREYHEETGNFGALTEHLLRFYEDDEHQGADVREKEPQRRPNQVARAESFIMYFTHARMVVVFCEVPLDAYARSLRPLAKADFAEQALCETASSVAGTPETASSAAATPAKKRRRKAPTETYRVGKENHLTPVWVSADALRTAVQSLDKSATNQRSVSVEVTVRPRESIDGTGHLGSSGSDALGGARRSVPFFPLNLSVFRQREARLWLGLV